MPESITSETCKPELPSLVQSSGPDIVHDHNPEIQSREPDVDDREKPQCLAGNTVGSTTITEVMGENTAVATDLLINNEEASELVCCASWLMGEQKTECSLPNLDTVIFLFRHVLEGRSPTKPLYLDASRDLVSALCVRFMHTDQITDIYEILKLRMDISLITMSQEEGNDTGIPPARQEDEEDIAISQLANELFTDFKRSTSLNVLNTVIFLVQQALSHLPMPSGDRKIALNTFVKGLHARQYYFPDEMSNGTHGGISALKEAMQFCIDWEQKLRLDLQMFALSMGQSGVSGNKSDLLLPMAYPQTHDQENAIIQKLGRANKRLEQVTQTGNMDDLNTVIEMLREVMINIPLGSESQIVCVQNLAGALNIRFTLGGQVSDLEESISLHRKALRHIPLSHPHRSMSLNNLGNALKARFERTDDIQDVEEAICLHRQALELRHPPHPLRSSSLNNLASLLIIQFNKRDQINDLDEAISLLAQALELRQPPHRLRLSSLTNLANALHTRFEKGGQRSDLDEAISLHKQACELVPSPHPDRSACLHNLAILLDTRFQVEDQINDLDEAIRLHRQALELISPRHSLYSTSLSNLANALKTRFKGGQNMSDLNEAITLHRQVVDLLPLMHPKRSHHLNELANALTLRFDQGGQNTDLDEAISIYRQGLELLPDQSMILSNLAAALITRFEHGGQKSDLDEVILLLRRTLELLELHDPLRSNTLSNLAAALNVRYDQEQQIDVLNEAISLNRQALELLPDRHVCLNGLAISLLALFKEGGQNSKLDEAISLHRQALKLLSLRHPERSNSLNNLANALRTRFEQGEQNVDLDEAIYLLRQTLELRPLPHPYHCTSLNNLASMLSIRFIYGSQKNDLDEAISLFRQALELISVSHFQRPDCLNNLALALNARFELGGQQSDLDETMSLLCAAAQHHLQSPFTSFLKSRRWIDIAEENQHSSLLAAYSATLQILPRIAALTLTAELRQQALVSRSDGLARDASRCAIRLGEITKAVEFLEAGRSVFWSQVLSLRSPFDRLRDIAPDGPILAARLQNIAQDLENGSHRQVLAHILDNRAKLSIDQESSRLNRLAEEWDKIVFKTRTLSGFEDFLLPPRISSLQSAASRHPIVLLIANDNESHCLVMMQTYIHHIPLPTLPSPILKVLSENVRMASSPSMSRSLIDKSRHIIIKMLGKQRGISYQHHSEESDGVFRFVLALLWEEVVKPIIDYLDIKKHSDESFTLQWCPSGYFTFLPIHAAGIYDANNLATDYAADYFISSYTPTIGILLAEPSSIPSQTFKMMTVIQSQELPSTKSELEKIRTHVPKDALIEIGVPESPAYVETVASRLSEVSIVHFACHGHQVPLDPLASGLKLDDGGLQISRIMKEKMPNGALAFLSACESAMGDEDLPDEAMSLAASLLFCGFRRVIATMWMMWDEDGPVIADAFYRELFRGADGENISVPDVTKSAYALHVAVQELRSQKVSFRRWVPFIHMGQC